MTEQSNQTLTSDDAAPMSPVPTDPLWVERNGVRTYTGISGRGARVAIGPAEAGAVFTPGELLKVALAACAGMSADSKFARVLGDDYELVIRVKGPKHETEDRYPELHETFEIDLSSLDDAAREKTLMLAQRSIDRACTVGNTLKAGAVVPPVAYAPPASEA
ncbi:OsmC family protein [Xylanimonas protaetiae]|uniref:Osmotically inducible protein OsmC n=1 Tax=Xylanimonas protaetiae TaxID=2509457 RepID=A0A4P6F1V7_9MICO|nr:OsmC family protein [Xylanimonas protaetiae]QAY69125.1 osmotically inducible protein OsmC [Xylanimonas protaetiae]